MSETERHNPDPSDNAESDNTTAENAAPDAVNTATEIPSENVVGLEGKNAQVAELEKKLADVTDRALRAMAEAENIRKRAEKERQDMAKFAIASFARDLLSVSDNLRRALSAITPEQKTENEHLNTIAVGVEATERELMRIFEKNHIKQIDALDKPFDPNMHDVMFEIDTTEKPVGTICQVVEEGYMIHERLLRPARVGVAKNTASPNAPEHTIDEEI